MRRLAVASSTLALVTASLATAPARADGNDTDRQIAQTLFDEGRALLEKKQYAEACPKFAESQRLDPGGGTLLNLALCHELEGRTATSWNEFRDALSQAVRDGRKDRQDLANEHIASLAPRLIRLVVVVPPAVGAREPEVVLDRSRLPAAAWGSSIPVDPGDHHVRVTAEGAPTWESAISAVEPGQTYRVEVPELERAAPLPPAIPREVRGRSTAFWALLAGGGASLGVSLLTGIMALDAKGYVDDNCSPTRDFCRVDDATSEASRARTLAWVSTATLVVGLAAGAVAFLLPLEKKSVMAAGQGVRIAW